LTPTKARLTKVVFVAYYEVLDENDNCMLEIPLTNNNQPLVYFRANLANLEQDLVKRENELLDNLRKQIKNE
jgi:hypothetical protein